MQCPCCGAAESVHDTREVPYCYKGQETTLPEVEGDFCPTCGEIVLDMAAATRVSSLVGDFMKCVNGSEEIAARQP